MEYEKHFYRRSNVLIAIFLVCLACFVGILYDAQIVNGSTYLARSTTQVTTSKTVESSRGIITDRNGKVLVSNQEIYTITFDPDLVEDAPDTSHTESVVRALLRLIQLCQAHGVTWTDNLPISVETPYVYQFSSASGRTSFQKYLADRGWSNTELTAASAYPLMSPSLLSKMKLETSTVLTAPHLLELMRTDFKIPADFSSLEARLTMGVLYELRLRALNAVTTPYVFAEDISVELISILTDGAFEGVTIGSRAVRQYHTSHAAHILGRVGAIETREERDALNEPFNTAREAGQDTTGLHYYQWDDRVGRDGVEKAFESYLCGKDGTRLITTNQEGKITSELYSIEPEPGGTVALTIDIDFQAEVEAALANGVETVKAGAKDDEERKRMETIGGAATVVSIANNEVLALATYPTYSQQTYEEDLEALSQNPAAPFTNRAINGTYAPGSTFKPLTAVAALESGIITPTTKINATGSWRYPGDPNSYANCWLYNSSRGRHGRINVSKAITVSCNYFFAQMGYDLGMDRLNEYASAFGLGEHTGIELSERTGVQHENKPGEDQAPWAGFGQASQLYTPLQLANYIAVLLRGGERLDAHLLRDVTAYDGSAILYEHQPEVLSDLNIAEETLAAVKKGMGDLVKTGSLRNQFTNCTVTTPAKTGSAQVGDLNANGVFVCFAPFEEPEIAVAVVIEQGRSGAALASTAVEILNAYFAPSDIGMALAPEGALLP